MGNLQQIKIAYIGGGSKMWARVFMNDLALQDAMCGSIALYDIDYNAACLNAKIGSRINTDSATLSKWNYTVETSLHKALEKADFVIISILPGTFLQMRSDVHAPEEFGILQSVGDTTGAGGVFRAMRTVPIYEEFAKAIRDTCPNAWVINLTNPMSLCVKTLYDIFPKIKAFGCCHEVFHTQEFLCCVLKEILGIARPKRTEIFTDVAGINHFTWISKAFYKSTDILSLLPEFIKRYFATGYYEYGAADTYKNDMFAYANCVKMDLYNRYGVLAAAGDRHLVEFMNNSWYLKDKSTVESYKFRLTTVLFREQQQASRIKETQELASGKKPLCLKKSTEEVVDLMLAILGQKVLASNVNMPNRGQLIFCPNDEVVETNCVFSDNSVSPVVSGAKLPSSVQGLIMTNLLNNKTLYEGIKQRNLEIIFDSFIAQPLCSTLSLKDARTLFNKMLDNTKDFLPKELSCKI